MDDSSIVSIQDIKEFIKVENGVKFAAVSKKEKYQWIDEVLTKFGYLSLKRKKDKSIVRKYIRKMTGLSNAQTTRIIKKKKQCGKALLSSKKKNSFARKYDSRDIALLVKTDNLHNRPAGPAAKRILRDECDLFGKKNTETLPKFPCRICIICAGRASTNRARLPLKRPIRRKTTSVKEPSPIREAFPDICG